MSHTSTIETVYTDKECLIQALKILGYSAEENTSVFKYGRNSTLHVDIKLNEYIGFVLKGDTYILTGDMMYLRDKERTLNKILCTYTEVKVTKDLKRQKFSSPKRTVDRNGETRLVFQRVIV